jgi:hypothetical protein
MPRAICGRDGAGFDDGDFRHGEIPKRAVIPGSRFARPE